MVVTVARYLVLLLFGALAGCATYPSTDDWPVRDQTSSIVKKARCETKYALMDQLAETIVKESSEIRVFAPRTSREKKHRLVKKLDVAQLKNMLLTRNGRDELERDAIRILVAGSEPLDGSAYARIYHAGRAGGPAEAALEQFAHTAISYSFTLKAKETNDNTIDVAFGLPFTGNSLALALKGGHVLDRQSERQFKVQDGFFALTELRCSTPASDSAEKEAVRDSLYYPMTGQIGLAKAVKFYVQSVLGEGGSIFAPNTSSPGLPKLPKGATSDVTEKIVFTTTLNGKINPTLEFEADPTGISTRSLGLLSEPKRVDTHQLIVNFITDPPAAQEKALFRALSSTSEEAVIQLAKGARITKTPRRGDRLLVISSAKGEKAAAIIGEPSRSMPSPTPSTLRRGLQRLRELEALPLLRQQLDEVR